MKRKRGFTLIELMIAVAVIAFLAAIALPSYQGQLRKSRRGAAQAFMMEISQRQQARFLDTRSFATINNNGEVQTVLGLPVPPDVSPYFDLDVDVTGPPPGFTVFAVAKGSQDFENQEDLQLRSNGFKARGDKAGASWDENKW